MFHSLQAAIWLKESSPRVWTALSPGVSEQSCPALLTPALSTPKGREADTFPLSPFAGDGPAGAERATGASFVVALCEAQPLNRGRWLLACRASRHTPPVPYPSMKVQNDHCETVPCHASHAALHLQTPAFGYAVKRRKQNFKSQVSSCGGRARARDE